jgi:WD40 repeat protein
MPISLLAQALELLAGSQLVKDKLQRNEVVIRVLKQLGLDPEHPPADFEGVYNYALVEYGVGKPKPCLEIFRASEIRQVFRTAFDQNDAQLWLASAEQFLESSAIGDAVTALGLDPQRELATFASCFIVVAKRTRTPGDVLMSHQVTSVQQQLAQVMARLEQMPTLAGMRTELERLAGEETALLPGASPQSCRAFALAQQMREWFETLGYRFESHEVWGADYFEWIIDIPVRRGRYDRVLVRGVAGEVGIKDVRSLSESVAAQKADEGWVVTARRIAQAARGELENCEGLAAFTLDELLDQDADFGGYLDWLESEIAQRGIEARYVPIACIKEEVDPLTHQRLGISRYGEDDGWTEGYMNLWLDDPAKEHLSILGEFGTGKTWLTLHYAAGALRAYREAKAKGMARPRLPIVIPLRDYAKAVSVESLFSEFFFRKHEIPIPGYSAFEQLNRMGKLLLIFDGFDEMAARVDKQQMINNFWELAKVVVPGSKVILTCRTEHFPEAREGRALLNAELQASTQGLSGETPQFEVLELEKFEDEQIRQVLGYSASAETVSIVMGDPQLLDLARRPVMTELILEALPEIEEGKSVDMSRVYLYAVKRKMERDIKAERTFTSMADKLYFLCELSWEMLSNDRMSLNYREFPDRLRQLFGNVVRQEKSLDHWQYDMMGQTMLIRNAEGDYSPAHRSLLEFFVAYKLVAMMGIMDEDFIQISRDQKPVDENDLAKDYPWGEYFKRILGIDDNPLPIAALKTFASSSLVDLRNLLQARPLSKAIIELSIPMLVQRNTTKEKLLGFIKETRGENLETAGTLNSNILNLLIGYQADSLEKADMSELSIRNINLSNICLREANLSHANLESVLFNRILGAVYSVAYSPDGKKIAVGDSLGKLQICNARTGEVIQLLEGHKLRIYSVRFSPEGNLLASASEDCTINLWDLKDHIKTRKLEGHSNAILAIEFSPDGKLLASGSSDCTIKLWDIELGVEVKTLLGHSKDVNSIAFSPDQTILVSGSSDKTVKLWNIQSGLVLRNLEAHSDIVRAVAFSPSGISIVSASNDKTVKIWNIQSGEYLQTSEEHWDCVRSVAFSHDGKRIASGSSDKSIRIWDAVNGQCLQIFKGDMAHRNQVLSVAFSPQDNELLSGSSDKTVKLWDVISGERIYSLEGYSSMVRSAKFSPDGQYIVSGGSDRTVKLWDLNAQLKYTLKGHSDWVRDVTFSNDGRYIASSSDDKQVRIWNTAMGELMGVLEGHTEKIRAVAFSPDQLHIATASDDSTVKIWNIQSCQVVRTFTGHTDWVRAVLFLPDGKSIASAGKDKTIKIWNLESGEVTRVLEYQSEILSIAVSATGNFMAVGGDDHSIGILNMDSSCLSVIKEHLSKVLSVAFSQNGYKLVSSSQDKTIKIWDVESGRHLKTLDQHSEWVWSVRFSTDGNKIISASDDQTIRIWDANTGECLQIIEDKLCFHLNITNIQGLSNAQKEVLRGYGAYEDAQF